MSMARYLSVCFPMFIALGATGRSPRVDTLIKVIFIALWGLMTVLFAGRFTMALT
jgi:FtsH-binding integral membrane protein